MSAFVNPVVWKLEDRAQAGAIALFAARLGTVMPFWYVLVFLVPINNRMARLSSDSVSETARREHKKWDALHRLRVVAVGVALICFLLRTHD